MIGVDDWLNRLQPLLADLGDAGLPTGLGEQLKVLRLLHLLEERGAAPDTPEGLALWVAPVLCSRSDQVAPLRGLLARHFRPRRWRVPEREPPGPAPMPRAGRIMRRFSLAWPAALLAIVVALGAGFYVLLQLHLPQITVLGNDALGRLTDTVPGKNLVASSIAIVFLLATITFIIWRRIRLAVRHGRIAGEGRAQQVRVEPPKEDKDNPELLRSARALNRPHRRRTGRLDVGTTVRATAAAGGRFSPVELIRRVPANWILLVERAGAEDPLPEFGARLSKLLGRSGVRHGVYEFRRSPESVRRKEPLDGARGPHMPLERALAADRPTRVLMLAEAARTVDWQKGGAARWISENNVPAPVVLLTPNKPENWSGAETLAAQSGILVLPADSAGLASLAQRMQAAELEPRLVPARAPTQFERWQEERFTWLSQAHPADDVRASLITTLRALLRKDEFRLLVGIAAFPQVRLDLMSTLDCKLHPADKPSAQRTRLLTLGRLVWVREGIIPDWLREDLMRALPPPELREVRESWMELLSDAPVPGKAAAALTIHLAEGDDQAHDAAQGDGLFLSFIRGQYDLPAPLRFVRLAGLWRAPDRIEFVAAAAGLLAAALAFFAGLDVATLAEHGLEVWYGFVRATQHRVPLPEQVWLALAFLPLVVALLPPLVTLPKPIRLLPRFANPTVAVLFGWLGISFNSGFDLNSALNDFLAPLIVGAGGAALVVWRERPAQRFEVEALNIIQRSRGTGLDDTPTMVVLLWLFVAGWLGWAIMPKQTSVLLANASLIALGGVGLARACLISWSNARLQRASPIVGVTRNLTLALLLGQLVAAAVAWMTMTNTLRNMGFSPKNYPFAMWQVSQGCMLFGAVIALSTQHGRRGHVSGVIFWCGTLALTACAAQGAALMLLTQSAFTDAAFLIAMLPAGPVSLLFSILAFRPSVEKRPFFVATIALCSICAIIGSGPFIGISQLMNSSWLPAVPLVAAIVTAWPLVQRALTEEPSIASEPPGWRARPVEPLLWVAAPVVLLTVFQIPLGPFTLDLPSLVMPLAIWLGWRFGLRGWRTALLMVLPALWPWWFASVRPHGPSGATIDQLLRASDASLPQWISPLTLDVAATALIAAALFARPGLFAQLRATARVSGWAVGALALALSIQVGGVPSDTRGLIQGAVVSQRGWAPGAFLVLALFLLATARRRDQAGLILGSVALAALASLGFAVLDLRTGPVLPLSMTTAVVGLIGYAVGRYHERASVEAAGRTLGLWVSAGLVSVLAPGFVNVLSVAFGKSAAQNWTGPDTRDALLTLAMLLAWTGGVNVGGITGFRVGVVGLAVIGLGTVLIGLPVEAPVFAPFLPLVLYVIGSRCSGAVTQTQMSLAGAPGGPQRGQFEQVRTKRDIHIVPGVARASTGTKSRSPPEEIGFSASRPMKVPNFPIDSLTLLAGALLVYYLIVLRLPFVPNQSDGWFFTASKVTIARLVSIGLTVWLMQHYSLFRRLPGGPPRYFGYVVCGVIAAAASAGVCLIFHLGDVIQIFRLGDVHALSGLIETARANLPTIVISGALCAALSFCCDDWIEDTVAPIWLRFVEAVGCGLVIGVVMVLLYFGTDLLPKGMSLLVLGLPSVLGLIVGGWVPHIFRSAHRAAKYQIKFW